MFTKTHNIQKLKAEIRVVENGHRADKKELRETQRRLSEHDKAATKDADWQRTRYGFGDSIGSFLSSVASGKESLTRLYQARAALRGRLHMSKRVIHHSNGKKEIENWTLEAQAQAVEDILDQYKLPSEEATKPAA